MSSKKVIMEQKVIKLRWLTGIACGSGKKYKKCYMNDVESTLRKKA